jgi:predicted transcriptional regulator
MEKHYQLSKRDKTAIASYLSGEIGLEQLAVRLKLTRQRTYTLVCNLSRFILSRRKDAIVEINDY